MILQASEIFKTCKKLLIEIGLLISSIHLLVLRSWATVLLALISGLIARKTSSAMSSIVFPLIHFICPEKNQLKMINELGDFVTYGFFE
jgi:hypothetical protein